jgi:hypothetical protein
MNIEKKEFYCFYDNILPEEQQIFIKKWLIENDTFPWFFYNSTVPEHYLRQQHNDVFLNDSIQLTHSFVSYDIHTKKSQIDSPYYNIAEIIIKKFINLYNYKNVQILRAKTNLQFQYNNTTENSYCAPHIDLLESHHVLIYYVNDSDGDTFLFDKNKKIVNRISPKKGRILFFNGDILHASSLPIKSKYRSVINFDIKILNNNT